MVSDPHLWQRLDEYRLDDPQAELSFSRRLARENGWTHQFAREAVEEYKRFVYLAMTVDHQVTPSDEIDQVWHLHLTYTRDYWGPFTQMLGRPLHHCPTQGGEREDVRYCDNYEKTLSSYQREFGDPAPAAYWPSSDIRFGRAAAVKRIDTSTHWVIAKKAPMVKAAAVFAGVVSCIAMVQLSMQTARAQSSQNESALEFLASLSIEQIIFVVAMVAFLIYRMLRRSKKHRDGGCGGAGCSSGCGGGGCGGD